jgi:glycine/D-amino acid oxidase-like deaminating enzyme
MLDVLIIGLGISGITLAQQLELNDKSFKVITDQSQQATTVAGGLFNPINFKRFSLAWSSPNQKDCFVAFYKYLEDQFATQFVFNTAVLRKFQSIKEQNDWFVKADRPDYSSHLNTQLFRENFHGFEAPFGYGETLSTGYVDTKKLQSFYWDYLSATGKLISDTFHYDQVQIFDQHIVYNGLIAKKIIFAEGYGLVKNPFFNYLPLEGSKGELLYAKLSIPPSRIISSNVFIIPTSDFCKIGATYHLTDKTAETTIEGREELKKRFSHLYNLPYEIIAQVAAVRPTVKDRIPLLGCHPKYTKTLFVFNGMGTRGTLLAPALAKMMYEFTFDEIPLIKEVNIVRYSSLFQSGL